MFCKECGKEIPDDARFCTYCGTKIVGEAPQEIAAGQKSSETDPQKASQPGIVCPKCGSSDLKIERFTWWGGILGAALADRMSCNACGHKFKIKR